MAGRTATADSAVCGRGPSSRGRGGRSTAGRGYVAVKQHVGQVASPSPAGVQPPRRVPVAAQPTDMGRALRDAARSGDATAVSSILMDPSLPHRAIDAPHACGWSPLSVAADRGHANVVTLLLEANAEVDAVDKAGRTALHHAAGCGSVECVLVLLAAGARCSAKDSFGKTPEQIARIRSHMSVVAAIRDTTDVSSPVPRPVGGSQQRSSRSA
eukprot:gnl/TRDRNA2_/TRDRNA2_80797_c0_seq2.p1 gnl/TRDRNA2_/TRDRNA2_80797_c0~~gnl/TRDRNA2_/TRDRNA2_80797_c0_seq2.p1  ORF type:complete len:228 (+),score=33.98 gnl/TRDRNA2_/TRDRNA2_80797_c0_seq2:46-684(+)